MKKKLAICLIISATLLFGGCMHEEYDTKISKSGQVKETIVSYVEKSSVEVGEGATASVNGKDVSTLPVVMYNGVECYKDVETKTYKTISEYKDYLTSDDAQAEQNIYALTSDTLYCSFNSKELLSTLALLEAYGKELKPTVVLSYEFDAPIVQTNGVIDANNPNRVTYTITSTSVPDEIFITTSSTVTKEKLKAEHEQKKNEQVKKASSIKKVKIKKVSRTKDKKTIKIKIKNKYKCTGYQVRVYRTKKNAKADKNVFYKKNVKYSKVKGKTIQVSKKKFKNKKLYVKVRAYNSLYGKKYYSKWSVIKKVK